MLLQAISSKGPQCLQTQYSRNGAGLASGYRVICKACHGRLLRVFHCSAVAFPVSTSDCATIVLKVNSAARAGRMRPGGALLSPDLNINKKKPTGPKAGRALEENEEEHDDKVALCSWLKSVEILV